MLVEPLHPCAKKRPIVVTVPRGVETVGVISMVTGAALQIGSSSVGGGLAFSTARIEDGTGCLYVGSTTTADAHASDVTQELSLIRDIGGLTRDQLAEIVGVSRRAVQKWASGGAIRNEHYGRLMKVVERIHALRAQPAFKVRQVLLRDYGISESRRLPDTGQPPVLASDDQPFVHHLATRKTNMKIKRK